MGFLDSFKGASKDEKKRESNTWNNLDNVFKSSFSSGVDHTRQLISSLLGEAQIAAGDKLAAIGSGETNAMMSALGVASGTESNLSSLLHQDIKEKEASAAKMWGSIIGGGLKLATGGLG